MQMNTNGAMFSGVFLALGMLMLAQGLQADDGGWIPREKRDVAAPDVAAVTNKNYVRVCGECHFPYQPGLLPARSWEAIMDHLPWHFGESLDMESKDLNNLKRYLSLSAADRTGFRRSIKIAVATPPNEVPLRISELSHIRKEHDKGGESLVRAAEKMGGFGKCDSCHTRAVLGYYNEDEVVLPMDAMNSEAR